MRPVSPESLANPIAVPRQSASQTRPKTPVSPPPFGAKRAFDLGIVLAAAPIWVPVVFLLWVLVRRDGHDGFFAQTRVGYSGRAFKMWKLRTMVPEAEAALQALLANDLKAAQEWEQRQKLTADPRLTTLGRSLRKYSLDELPQLWNVLRGEMSLIGPRPFLPEQKPLYDAVPGSNAYYTVRPGIGGPWQVGSRNASSFKSRVAYDAKYVSDLSLYRDLVLLVRSAARMVRPSGI